MKTPWYRAVSSSIWLLSLPIDEPTNVIHGRQSAILPLVLPPSADVFSCPCESAGLARKCQGNVPPNVVCHGTRVVVGGVRACTKLFEKWVTRLFDVSRLFLAQKTISEFVQQQIGIWVGIWVEILGYFFSLPPSFPFSPGELISFTNSGRAPFILSREFIRPFTIFASRSNRDPISLADSFLPPVSFELTEFSVYELLIIYWY